MPPKGLQNFFFQHFFSHCFLIGHKRRNKNRNGMIQDEVKESQEIPTQNVCSGIEANRIKSQFSIHFSNETAQLLLNIFFRKN